jgi:hypothetical protein
MVNVIGILTLETCARFKSPAPERAHRPRYRGLDSLYFGPW